MNKYEDIGYPISIITGDENDYLDKIERKSTSVSLIAQKNNLEVIHQIIEKDKIFMIKSEKDAFEFYYILNGKVKNKDTDEVLRKGNFISVNGKVNETYFKTLEKIEILIFTNQPIFMDAEKRFKELISLNEKIYDKDQETKEHCSRLNDLSIRIAEKLNLQDRQIFNLSYAAFLHDIGKVEIDSKILKKPGSLTEKEWEEMKSHSLKGRDIILKYLKEGYFEDVARIVHQHHERFDGNGYPEGLKDEEIMIEAQILTVVDAYDAMTNQRPYQKKLSREKALQELNRCKGGQFSPEVVDAFLKAELEFFKNKN